MHGTCEGIFSALRYRLNMMRLRAMLEDLTENSNRVSACLQRLETRLLIEELSQGSGRLARH
jgi:hypothetical protein